MNTPGFLYVFSDAERPHMHQLKKLCLAVALVALFMSGCAKNQQAISNLSNDTANANLGFCHDLAGHKDYAEKAYQEGIAHDPANVSCRVNFGLFLAKEGRTEEAAAQWRAVLSEAQVHYNLGSIYEQQNKRDQAKAEFRQAIQHDANLVDAKTRLAALD